jgi:hypothetical protein
MPEVMFSWRCFVSLYVDRNNKGTGIPLEVVSVVGAIARVVHKTDWLYLSESAYHWHICTFTVSYGMRGYRGGCNEDPNHRGCCALTVRE